MAAVVLLAPAAASAAPPRPGTLDRSFGNGGRAYTKLRDTFVGSEFTALVRQPDGKLLVTANLETGTGGFRGAVQRRGPAGSLDPSFGKGGSVTAPAAHGLALQSDGRVLFGVEEPSNSCGARARLHRLEPNGDPDPSFGTAGASAAMPLSVEGIAVAPDGRIVVAGRAFYGPCGRDLTPRPELAVARLQPDGTLDPGFGNGGIVLAHSDGGLEESEASGLAVLADGAILVSGSSSLLRLSAAGALDPGFGNGGVVEPVGQPRALLALPGGEVVLASLSSHSCCSMPGDYVLSRYRSDGALDPGFGNGGRASLDVSDVDEASALAAGPDGNILLAGGSARGEGCEGGCDLFPVLLRVTATGAPDPGFGENGRAAVSAPSGPALGSGGSLTALAVTPGGQVLAAGDHGIVRGDAFILGLEPNGASDPHFGRIGSVREIRQAPSVTEAGGLAIEPDGEILVTAQSNASLRRQQSFLLNYKPSGHLERRVGGYGYRQTVASGALRAGGPNAIFSVLTGEPERVVRVGNRGGSDNAYGKDGAARLPTGFTAASFLVHDGGKVLVVGRMAHHWGMAAFQLNRRGRPDGGFGHHGLAIAGFGKEVNAEARSAAVDSRGRIVLAGSVRTSAAAVRLLPDGRLDHRFGRRGRLANLLGRGTKATRVIALRGGGALIAATPEAGLAPTGTTLLRLGSDGARDRSFGRGGIRRAGGGVLLGLFAGAGRIVVVSAHEARGEGGVTLRGYRMNGAADRRFGRRGVTVAAVRQRQVFRPIAAARQPGGRIVVAGTAGKFEEPGSAVELLRFR